MKPGVLFATVLSVFLLAAGTATAKGPTAARITGPGLSGPILLSGVGESGDGSPMAVLTVEGGFFPATFGESPDPMLPTKPSGELGPRYTVLYTVPGPTDKAYIRQSLFPYVDGGPILYTPPNQPFFDGERTRGGWFRATTRLKAALVHAGLPETAPATGSSAEEAVSSPRIAGAAPGSGDGGPTNPQIGIAALAAAVAAALGAPLVLRRRRSRTLPRPAARPSRRSPI
jgi:hypothetical protein